MNERPDLYEYQQTIFKRFNMKKIWKWEGRGQNLGSQNYLRGFRIWKVIEILHREYLDNK